MIRLQQGRLEEGAESLRQSLLIEPDQPVALNNLAAALRGLGRADAPMRRWTPIADRSPPIPARQASSRSTRSCWRPSAGWRRPQRPSPPPPTCIPIPAPLRHAQGAALYRLGRLDQAIDALRQAADLTPTAAEPLSDLGAALDESGRLEEALAAFDKALALYPRHPQALNNQALVLLALGRPAEALAQYDKAVEAKPDYATAWVNRADALAALGRFEEALTSTGQTIAIEPGSADAWVRRGDMLGYLRRLDEAAKSYARARELDPANVRAAFHLAFPLLREGRYAEGLPIYEHRWSGPLKDALADLPRPLWLGETPVEGKTMLLHSEQGHGDT